MNILVSAPAKLVPKSLKSLQKRNADMKNKTILITGGTTGIGLATAKLLCPEGASVIVTGRNPEM